ncbi:MAG: SusC/RagA family TonB-linked outer membrane protein [Chitinophagaceae bacterium]
MILLPALHANKVKKFTIILFIAICLPVVLLAQNTLTVSGQVRDSKNKLLHGASILLKGTERGTTTDADGRFVLSDVPSNGVLVFSSTGFAGQEISVSGKNILNVTLIESASSLEEVVVVGYGTRQKKDVTGAVGQLKATKLENENPASVQDLLRGNIAGLNVTTTTTAKGGGGLLVRGKSSLEAGTDPLIVLDGVIYPGQLADINPNDIQTIDVLKDASSAAVFGAKSASGVILITTKKGSTVKSTITVNTNMGVAQLAMDEPLYDGPGFIAWRTDVLKSINFNARPYHYNDPRTLPPDITEAQWRNGQTGDLVDLWLTRLKLLPIEIKNYKEGKTINWYDMMFQKGLRQDHTVSISGKKEDITYYMSVGYNKNEGVIVGDEFSTVRTRLNLEARAAKFMNVGINMQYADRDESSIAVSWTQMVNASPYGDLYQDDGVTLRDSPNDDFGNNRNPFLDNTYTNQLEKINTLFGSIYAKGDLPYGFSYQVNFSPNFGFRRYFNGISAKHRSYAARKGIATRIDETTYNWQVDNLLKWNRRFNQHQVDVTLLANAEKFQSWYSRMDNEGFDPNDNLSYHNIGSGIKPVLSSNDEVSTGDALMARVNYAFRDKYLFTGSIRRDGYSAFGLENPRATFPAAAVGWVFSKENFISTNWLSYGKLRLSYGVNGNRDIGRYLALADLNTGKYQYVKADGTVLLVSQLYVSRLQNPALKWEKTTSLNLGLDFSIFKDRFGGSIDVYKKSTSDLLIDRALPDVTGFDNILSNLGEVENKGIELSLNSLNFNRTNFSWRSFATFTLNRNKIVHLYGPVDVFDANGKVIGQIERDDTAARRFIGHDIDEIWDLNVLGVWQVSDSAEARKYGVRPGDFRIQDVNGDGKYSDADRQFIGHRTPRFQWTLRNEFTILKNLDFSFMLYANWGMKSAFNQAKNNSGFFDRQNSYILPYWTAENPSNEYARLYSSNGGAVFSVWKERSYIRLSTVAVAYTLPLHIIDKVNLQSAKVYLNINNAGIYQPHWTFWDAEYGNTPPPRYYSLGLNITL